jgi:hypothetical protein
MVSVPFELCQVCGPNQCRRHRTTGPEGCSVCRANVSQPIPVASDFCQPFERVVVTLVFQDKRNVGSIQQLARSPGTGQGREN